MNDCNRYLIDSLQDKIDRLTERIVTLEYQIDRLEDKISSLNRAQSGDENDY